MYQDPSNGGYGMYDTNMNQLGTCVKPSNPQIANCPDVGSADSVANIFQCMYLNLKHLSRFQNTNSVNNRHYEYHHHQQQLDMLSGVKNSVIFETKIYVY